MNINYQNSSNYPNLAQLWLDAATAENQDTNTKHHLFEMTTELTDRIKNINEDIPHKEISQLCDTILTQFDQLTPENKKNIAKFIGTTGETGYGHLYELFQTIFTKNPIQPSEGIINLSIEAKNYVDLSKESPIFFSSLEEDIRDKIFSYMDDSSKTLFNSTSKQGMVQLLNSGTDIMSMFDIKSIEDLIEFLGENGKLVKKLPVLNQHLSADLLKQMSEAFPKLQELFVTRLDNDGALILKDFKSLNNLEMSYCPKLTDGSFLEKFSSLRNLILKHISLEDLDVKSLMNLRTLEIEMCSRLTTLNNAKNLTSLSEITITNCHNVNLNFLEIPNLTKLTFIFCFPAKNNLSSLANHPKISELIIMDDLKVENFDFLLEMPSLKIFKYANFELPEGIENKLRQKGVEVINTGHYRLI